jgi:hypothetical protein
VFLVSAAAAAAALGCRPTTQLAATLSAVFGVVVLTTCPALLLLLLLLLLLAAAACVPFFVQARAWGLSLADVPQEPLPDRERSLCDRCGTQIAGLVGHCSSCEWDCCSSCVSQLRQHTLQQQQQGASAGSSRDAEHHPQPQQQQQQQVPVTCCNPACPSVPGSRRSSSNGGSKRKGSQSQQQQQLLLESVVERGQLWGVAGGAELALQVVLPPDLLSQLGRLQQLAQVRPGRLCSLFACHLLGACITKQRISRHRMKD